MMTGLFQVHMKSTKESFDSVETKVSSINIEIQELKGRMTTIEGKKGDQGPSDMATDPAQEASQKRVGWVRNEGDGVWGPPPPSPSPNNSGNG
eukprot:1535104-Heterocapsa_arctica.AAC.1